MSCRTTAGGSASMSLAGAYTSLPDSDLARIFHALKREGKGVANPSEFEMSEWRDRQLSLLDRATRMSAARKDAIRDRLFQSRGQPSPNGSTFYAWSRIEGAARQEVAIRAVGNAVDLEPPGSQADLYELGEDGRPARVWYASYGSNLHRARFMKYVEGGEAGSRKYLGCDDKTPPVGDIPIRFHGARPHFALTSRVWRGGIAFLDTEGDDQASALGRAYNISIGQFDQVIAQENGGDGVKAPAVDTTEVLTSGRAVTGGGAYETLVHIGDYQGSPVLTMTAPFTAKEAIERKGRVGRGNLTLPVAANKPSAAYAHMIGSGLGETFGMDPVAQADYIRGCPGGDRWSRRDLVKILRSETPPPIAPTSASTTSSTSSRSSRALKFSDTDKPLPNTGNDRTSANVLAAANTSICSTGEQKDAALRHLSRIRGMRKDNLARNERVLARIRTGIATDSGRAAELKAASKVAKLNEEIEDLDRAVAHLRAQPVATYYAAASTRTAAAWKEEDAKVLGLYRVAEYAHDQAQKEFRDLPTNASASRFDKAERAMVHTRKPLAQLEQRLSEISQRIRQRAE